MYRTQGTPDSGALDVTFMQPHCCAGWNTPHLHNSDTDAVFRLISYLHSTVLLTFAAHGDMQSDSAHKKKHFPIAEHSAVADDDANLSSEVAAKLQAHAITTAVVDDADADGDTGAAIATETHTIEA